MRGFRISLELMRTSVVEILEQKFSASCVVLGHRHTDSWCNEERQRTSTHTHSYTLSTLTFYLMCTSSNIFWHHINKALYIKLGNRPDDMIENSWTLDAAGQCLEGWSCLTVSTVMVLLDSVYISSPASTLTPFSYPWGSASLWPDFDDLPDSTRLLSFTRKKISYKDFLIMDSSREGYNRYIYHKIWIRGTHCIFFLSVLEQQPVRKCWEARVCWLPETLTSTTARKERVSEIHLLPPGNYEVAMKFKEAVNFFLS